MGAYGKALEDVMQRLYYNLFLTTTSGLIALLVGVIEVLGAIQIGYGLHGGLWDVVAYVNSQFEIVGYVVIGIFGFSLLLALGCFREFSQGATHDQTQQPII